MKTFTADDVKTLFSLLYKLEAHFEDRAKLASASMVGKIINDLNAYAVREV